MADYQNILDASDSHTQFLRDLIVQVQEMTQANKKKLAQIQELRKGSRGFSVGFERRGKKYVA